MSRIRELLLFLFVAASAFVLSPAVGWASWLKLDPSPDVDKAAHGHTGTSTCWLASSANMLAGAGYGTTLGATPQQRADAIYNQLVAHFGTGPGWIDNALSWWLANQNDDPGNDYDSVTVYGNKTKVPWNNANGARFIANELRRCQLVGLSMSWVDNAGNTSGGHAVTAWGDNGANSTNPLTGNPSQIMIADSDRDLGGDVQTYNNTWQNGNAGNGWYPSYSSGASDAFIKHIVTLCGGGNRRATGSTIIRQESAAAAIGLQYTIHTDVPIRSYNTDIDWSGKGTKYVNDSHMGDPHGEVDVSWMFSSDAPQGTEINISAELTMDDYNSVWFKDVGFSDGFERFIPKLPDHGWRIASMDDDGRALYGGYVIGAYELAWINPVEGPALIPFRLEHQFGPNTDREYHVFVLSNDGTESFSLNQVMFGYSDSYLSNEELWSFQDWRVSQIEGAILDPGQYLAIPFQFDGLPYYVEDPNPMAAVPEPPAAVLLAVAMGILLIRRRWRGCSSTM